MKLLQYWWQKNNQNRPDTGDLQIWNEFELLNINKNTTECSLAYQFTSVYASLTETIFWGKKIKFVWYNLRSLLFSSHVMRRPNFRFCYSSSKMIFTTTAFAHLKSWSHTKCDKQVKVALGRILMLFYFAHSVFISFFTIV